MNRLKTFITKKPILIVLQVLLIGGSLALAVYSLRNNEGTVNFDELNPVLLLVSVLLYILFYVFLSIHWAFSLHIAEVRKLDWRQVLAFFASQPYKYLPTSIFSMSARSIYSKKIGARNLSSTAKAQLYEYASLFLSGFVIMFLAKTGINIIIPIILILAVSLLLFSWSITSQKRDSKLYRYTTLLSIVFIAWLIAGLSFFVIIQSLGAEISYKEAVFLNAATFLASIAAVLVPAGIGIREAILFNQNISFGPVLVWRAVSIFVDMVTGITAIYKISKIRSQDNDKNY